MHAASTVKHGGLLKHGSVIVAFVAMTILLSLTVDWGARDPRADPVEPNLIGLRWLDNWVRWDGGWYLGIAELGYSYSPTTQSPIAFFPSYPIAIRSVMHLTGNAQIAAQLVTWVCGLAAVVLFTRWAARRVGWPTAYLALALLLLYPYSFYMHLAVYGDSMFLLAAVAAMLLVEREHFWLAGIVAATATAGRPVGLAVAVGVVVRALEIIAERRRFEAQQDPRLPSDQLPVRVNVRFSELIRAVAGVRLRHVGVLLSLSGFIAWCVWLWVKWGDPFLWMEAQQWWHQGGGPRTWFKVAFAARILTWEAITPFLIAQAAMCLIAVLLIVPAWRRFGWGYAAYSLAVVAIPIIGTKDFMGCGRYMFAAFPLFVAAAAILANPRRRWLPIVVLIPLAALLVVMSYFYGYGIEVS